MEEDALDTAAAYYARLTGHAESAFRKQVASGLEAGASSDPYDRLINGLTSLRRATWDVQMLLREAVPIEGGLRKTHSLALGLLFELRVKLDSWVAEPVKAFLAEQGKDSEAVLRAGAPARQVLETHHAALKVIRDRVFHLRPWPEDEVITVLVEAMFRADIHSVLLAAFEKFGTETVRSLCKERIGIPGIGNFGIICR